MACHNKWATKETFHIQHSKFPLVVLERNKMMLNIQQIIYVVLNAPPENTLTLQQVLQAQQALFPLRPVGAGAVVQHLGHILCLTKVMRNTSITGTIGSLWTGTGRVAVSIVIRLIPPSQWLALRRTISRLNKLLIIYSALLYIKILQICWYEKAMQH